MKFSNFIPSKLSKNIGFILDNFLPLFVRDNRFIYGSLVKLWNSKLDLDFKRRAFHMTEMEFADAYEKLSPMRSTDNTTATNNFVFDKIVGDKILEVGSGNGDMALEIAKTGKDVMATDISSKNIEIIVEKSQLNNLNISTGIVNIECIPFNEKSFDTTICLHTLEHVRLLHKSIEELKRVTKKRIIIVVPKQRFHKYTADYHLNFWGESAQLLLSMNIPNSKCIEIDNCLCFWGDL